MFPWTRDFALVYVLKRTDFLALDAYVDFYDSDSDLLPRLDSSTTLESVSDLLLANRTEPYILVPDLINGLSSPPALNYECLLI